MQQRPIWILAAATFAVLCAAAVGSTIWRDRAAALERIVADTDYRADLMAAHAEQGLASAAQSLDRASGMLAGMDLRGPVTPAAYDWIRRRLDDLVIGNTAVGTIWVVDPNGISKINNTRALPYQLDVSSQRYFQRTKATPQGLVVGPSQMGRFLPRPRFTLSRRIETPTDAFAGIVVAGINQEFLEGIYRRVRPNSETALFAFNDDGDLLAADPVPSPADLARARQSIDAMGNSTAVDDTVDGWQMAVRRLDQVPMTLVAATDVAPALSEWRAASLRLALFGLLTTLGFFALTLRGIGAVRQGEAASAALVAANETLEARVAERTQTVDLLFRELNHRVKNNLQIIASLLRLQRRTVRDPAVQAILQDSINRIFAIADVHGQIENAKNGAISLESYVGKIVGRLCDAMAKPDQTIATSLDVAAVDLPLDRAVLIAIALNETVTNAFKHAFVNRPEGKLAVRVEIDDGSVVLVVWNDLPGEDAVAVHDDEAPPTSGLGSSIVGMLVQQMAGTLTIDRADGYTVRIRVPMT